VVGGRAGGGFGAKGCPPGFRLAPSRTPQTATGQKFPRTLHTQHTHNTPPRHLNVLWGFCRDGWVVAAFARSGSFLSFFIFISTGRFRKKSICCNGCFAPPPLPPPTPPHLYPLFFLPLVPHPHRLSLSWLILTGPGPERTGRAGGLAGARRLMLAK